MYRIILIDTTTIQLARSYEHLEEALIEYQAYDKLNADIKIYLVELKPCGNTFYYKIIKTNV